MDEIGFRERYLTEIPIFKAWGDFVDESLIQALTQTLGDINKVNQFLKIRFSPRVKDIDSMISKAFYRGKNYSNPYEDITDKVGVRYVVLMRKEILNICKIVEHNNDWEARKDRDFEEEKNKEPYVFGYQSDHYIIKNKKPLSFHGVTIPLDTPCEIQIRTLLQHAYSELTHDRLYKHQGRIPPFIARSVAKSMALIEATDDIFEGVDMTLEEQNKKVNSFLRSLTEIYQCYEKPDYEERANRFILEAFHEQLENTNISDIDQYVRENISIKDIIKRKYSTFFLYRQPVILFLYFLITRERNNVKRLWPLTESEIRPLFSDLGISFNASI